VKAIVLSLLGLWPALSSTISVSSTGFTITATATLISPGAYASDSQSYSQNYVLLVTGGSGGGMAYPAFLLSGSTNESNGAWNILGSWAEFAVAGAFDIQAGDPYGAASQATPPGFACGPHTYPSCGIPFSFGAAETIHVRALVEAMIQPGPYAPSNYWQNAAGSVVFDFDSFILTDQLGQTLSEDPIVILSPVPLSDSVPEPGPFATLAAGLAVLLVRTSSRAARRRALRLGTRP
jgi:hypothetical protein